MRTHAVHSAMIAEGVPPARAVLMIDRLATIAKRRRQAKMPRIDRERTAVRSARSDMQEALNKFFPKARKDLAKQITAARKKANKMTKADGAKEELDAKVQSILDSLDFSTWEKLQSDLADILISITQDGIGVAFDQIGFEATSDITDQVNAKAVEWAKERSAEMVGMTFDEDGNLVPNPNAEYSITETTRDMLRGSVASAIENGTSTSDFADELEDQYAFSSDRAEVIARTEIARADVEGNMTAYRDSGSVSGKEWILGSEHADDDECDDAANMGVVPLDDDFGGLGDPPAHPNCVCDVLPVLAGDE